MLHVTEIAVALRLTVSLACPRPKAQVLPLSTLLLYTLSLCSFLDVTVQASHPYKKLVAKLLFCMF
jgi:hypothetical protein